MTEVAALVLAAVFALGGVTKLVGVPQARAVATRLGTPYAVFRFVGCCELAGGTGLLLGVLVEDRIGVAAAVGLTLLALSGCVAHFRAREPWTAYLPAVVLGGCTLTLALIG